MLAPSYRLINPQANRSFVFKWEPFDLTTRWHYHPEAELIYFIEGNTSGIMGDGFHQFAAGDLVLLGPNFPHVLQEDISFARQYPDTKPFGLIIQFRADFLGTEFLQKPELADIRRLLMEAQRGVQFAPGVTKRVGQLLLQMPQQTESRKLLSLLEVLTELSEAQGIRHLTAEHYVYDHTQDEERMHAIKQFVYEHFREAITIAQIASVANMTETSFCRYFKTRTLKTFIQFLNEIRIAYACRLLNQPAASITAACFEAGFNSLSYFNRQFKATMGMSPMQYQRWKRKAVGVEAAATAPAC